MSKIALVLSGGGAKGAFQFMAEKYAREEKGYEWDIIAGVSVGALNGVMLAMEKYKRLEELWNSITKEDVYTGDMRLWRILLRVLLGAKSILGNEPLRQILDRELERDRIKVDVKVGVVSFSTGEYKMLGPSDFPEFDDFKRAVLASTAIPIIWPPEDISPSLKNMVDGGIRNISPLADVLDANPEEIVIINCSPQEPGGAKTKLSNIFEIGMRALDVAMNEILMTDVREFMQINRMVKQAEKNGLTLKKENGEPFKYFKCQLIEPNEPLDDTLDFSRDSIKRSMDAGWERAKQILG
jgi:NTE family protein